MRRSLFCSFLSLLCSALSGLILLSSSTVFANAQTATVSMRPSKDVRAIVAVKVNGVGPYDFMVDTGATATVLDAALFQELGLKPDGSIAVNTVAGSDTQARSTVKGITLEGLSVQNLMVVRASKLPGVRGILGENFLQHFDIMIDNQHRKITLDAGSGLADSLDGEHMPITFPATAEGDPMHYRPMVFVSVPEYGPHPVKLLLDSGADNLALVRTGSPLKPQTSDNVWMVKTVNGSMSCAASEDKLSWGKTTMHDITMLACQTPTVSERDHDGNLPTAIFKQIFISHAGSYAIVNPAQRKPGLQEIAVVTPLSR
jgi:predicted aspartyl protease